MIIVLLGPPGSGKGTQVERISKELGFYKISMGDLLREAITKDDEIGKKAKNHLVDGKLVPDYLVLEMVRRELEKEKGKGDIVFDGFPRNLNQAISFDRLLNLAGKKIDIVLYFDIPFALLARRLSQRRVCPRCSIVYNLETAPPRSHNICDKCGSTLVKRRDDSEKIVKSRFQVYERETAPVEEFYKRRRNLLIKICSDGSKDEVWKEIKKHIEKKSYKENSNQKGG